jgi:gas vesicle protein
MVNNNHQPRVKETNNMSERIYYSQEAEQRARQERNSMAMLVLVLGLGIGAAMALLFAPRNGDETRKVLGDQVEQVYDGGREVANTAVDTLRGEFTRLRSDVEDRLKHLQQ